MLENQPAETEVGTLTTIDQDTINTHQYELLDNAQGRFQLVENTIVTVRELNYEAARRHWITVRATDDGEPPLSVEKRIPVFIQDMPVVDAGNDQTAVVGEMVRFFPEIIDPPYELFHTNSVKWDFGEGGGRFDGPLFIGHQYQAAGIYTARIWIYDEGKFLGSDSVTVTVEEAQP